MSSSFGNNIKLSVFGESHGKAIGAVIEGLPSGFKLDMGLIEKDMKRRAPTKSDWSTHRGETDEFEIVSGFFNGKLTGAPLCVTIKNKDAHSKDYSELKIKPRPGHADYTANVKYKDNHDYRGGGHFSGRLTAPIVFAGAIAKQILKEDGIEIGAHIYSIKGELDSAFNLVNPVFKGISDKLFPVIDDDAGERMKKIILDAKNDLNSVGGVIECAIKGLKAGTGGPLFGGLEGKISLAVFAVPAVKAVEFGAGTKVSVIMGSENNDEFLIDKVVKTKTNNCGGILGGISNGMPIIFKASFKPTPSISRPQNTVNLETMENTTIEIKGRHDPCIVVRAVPVVEAMSALVILDEIILDRKRI
jgi:chorismate synthase